MKPRRDPAPPAAPPSHRRPRHACAPAALLLALVAGCAPVAALGPPGMVTAVAPGAESSAAGSHHLGDIADLTGDSLVVLVFGDNRPGYRLQAGPGYHGVAGFSIARPASWLPALGGLPVLLVRTVVPTLDGVQDLIAAFTRRPNGGAEARVLEAMTEMLPADLAINTGDVVYQGHRAKLWRDFERRFGTPDGPPEGFRARTLFLAAPGNHERMHLPEGRANWSAVLGAPPRPMRFWFSADAGGGLARFVFLDSNVLANVHGVYAEDEAAALSEEQLEWLDRALDTDAPYRFVVLHHPLALVGSHGDDWSPAESARRRDRVLEICARRGVTAVLAGHEHLYHRVRATDAGGAGCWFVTTGGGGSPLHRVVAETAAAEHARALPAGLRYDPASVRIESRHHFLRLVIPAAADAAPRLDVHAVLGAGRTRLIERLELDRAH